MPKSITSYPFSQQELQLLNSKGFTNIEDLQELSPSELSKELGVTTEKALSILQVVSNVEKNDSHANDKSAYELLQEEESESPIVTFCAELDNMIGGGIPIGKITEFCGAPGAGKTQIGIQLAVDVQIPEPLGGVDGEAIYIDCEGSFICERAAEIAQAALDHLTSIAGQDKDFVDSMKSCSLENFLRSIHVFRCHDYFELIALSHTLPEFLTFHPRVKLIVLDSIAFHFRHDFDDMALRSRLLQGLVQTFMKIAHGNKLAVVFMNQMTTKIYPNRASELVPALGQTWGHACTIRIVLAIINGQRYARLLKSPFHQEATVRYEVTSDGIRDVNVCDSSDERNKKQKENVASGNQDDHRGTSNPSKRQRVGN